MTVRIATLSCSILGLVAGLCWIAYRAFFIQMPDSSTPWLGTYVRQHSNYGTNATLTILESRDSVLTYKLVSSYGAHVGMLEATATSTGADAVSTIADSPCTLSFRKTEMTIAVHARDCGEFHAAPAEFDGVYELNGTVQLPTLAELGGEYPIFRSSEEVEAFTRMVTPEHVSHYTQSFVDVIEAEDLDQLHVRVYRGAVPGLYATMEAIILIGEERDDMWAAVIQDNRVVYATNVPAYAERLPKTIDVWRERFNDMPVDYFSAR